MINEDNKAKLKAIVHQMNKETHLEDFCETVEKETNGKMTFTQLKELIDKNYQNTSKNDKLTLLKEIGLDKRTGMVSLYELFDFFARVADKKILSPILAFYSVAKKIEEQMQITTLEFIYKAGLVLDAEININEFYKSIANGLKIDDLTSIIIFKGLDYTKRGKIKVEDFVLVIDSYREDFLNEENVNQNFHSTGATGGSVQNYEIAVERLKQLMDKQYLTVKALYDKLQLDGINYAEYGQMFKLLKSELIRIEMDSGEISDIEETIKNVLNILKKEGNKIFQVDFQNAFSRVEEKNVETLNPNKLSSTSPSIFLNDVQLYWINKYLLTLESINITEKMAFDLGKDTKSNVLHLDLLKKKLKLLLSVGKLSAMDLNTMVEALDVHKKRFLTQKEYEEIIKSLKTEQPTKTGNKSLSSTLQKNKNNLTSENFNPNSTMKKSLMNKWARGTKSVNYHLLPVKGNNRVLSNLREEINRNINYLNLSSGQYNTMSLTNNTIESPDKTQKANSNLFIQEKLEATENAVGEREGVKLYTNADPKHNSIQNFNPGKDLKQEEDDSQLVDAFENFSINDSQGIVPSYNFFNYLRLKMASDENYSKNKISGIVREIDKNKDGYITYNDLINHLLKAHKHRSTKLAFKAMANKIHNELKINTEEFFTSHNIDTKVELNVNNFCEILYKLFEFENPVSKKIYEEMKVIYGNQKSKLTFEELIDLIDEHKEDVGKVYADEENGNKILNMKEFEDSLKSFVYYLIDDERQKINLNSSKQNLTKFRENLKCAVNLDPQMNMQQFKDSFIKPLRMEMNLGVAVFQLLKNFSHKNEQLINREDLIIFLESYIDDGNNQQNMNSNKTPGVTDLNAEISLIVNSLESTGCPLRYVYDNIPYNKKGLITCVNFINHMSTFYPTTPRINFSKFLSELDESKFGHIKFENLQSFLNEHSKKDKFSLPLEIKKMASEVDKQLNNSKKSNSPAIEYFSSLSTPVNNFNSVKLNEHMVITDRLGSTKMLKEEMFHFLCQKCGSVSGYDISVLCDLIDNYRDVDTSKFNLNQNIENNEQIENNTTSVNSVIEEFNNMLKMTKNSTFDNFIENLKIGEKGEISVMELIRIISSSNLSIDKSKISLLVKSIDSSRKGSITYETLHQKLREIFQDKYIGSLPLIAKQIFITKIKPEFNSDIKNFIFSSCKTENKQNLTLNTLFTKDNFSSSFLEFFLNDILLFNKFSSQYQEKGAKNKGMISLKKFFNFIVEHNKENIIASSSGIQAAHKEPDDELDNEVFHIFNDIEETKIPMKNFFDFLSINLLTPEGWYKDSEVRKLLTEKLSLSDEEIEKIIRMFSIQENFTFDLCKMSEYVVLNCEKSHCDIDSVLAKMKNSITKLNITQFDQFLKKFSLRKEATLTLKDIAIGFPPIFKISLFECYILFLECEKIIKSAKDKTLNMEFIFVSFPTLNESFKTKSEEKSNVDLPMNSSLKLALTKLSNYLDKEKDKAKIFKTFDADKNGTLSNQEFLTALNTFKDLELNDSQKVSLLKVADKNKDGKINFSEFMEFLKYIKTEIAQNGRNNAKNLTNHTNTKKGFIPKIELDFKKLKVNYEFNSRKINPNNKTIDKYINYMFLLQEDLYQNFTKFENIEQDFNLVDENLNGSGSGYLILRDKFLLVLKKRLLKIDPTVVEKIIQTAAEDLNPKEKEKLKSGEKEFVNYKNFLLSLVNFRFNVQEMKSTQGPPACPPPRMVKQVEEEEDNFDDDDVPVVQKKTTRTTATAGTAGKNTNRVKSANPSANTTKNTKSTSPVVKKPAANNKSKQVNTKKQPVYDEFEDENVIDNNFETFSGNNEEEDNNKTNSRTKTPNSIMKNPKPVTNKKTVNKPVKFAKQQQEDEDENWDVENVEEEIRKPVVQNKNIGKKTNSNNSRPVTSRAPVKKRQPEPEPEYEPEENEEFDNQQEEEEEITPPPKKKVTPNKPVVRSQKRKETKIPVKKQVQIVETDLNVNEEEKQKLGKVYYGNIGSNIDINNSEDIEKAQSKMVKMFSCKTESNTGDKSKENGSVMGDKNKEQNFKNFIAKINNLKYTGYDYNIVPEKDYFSRVDGGERIPTILNSEDAAIKKCEEIYNSLKEGEKYFDKDFGEQPNDNGEKAKFSLYINGNPPKGGVDPKLIQWSRIGEISRESPPVFVDDGVESNDVMQGAIGDCWFISALSVLATKDHLLRGEFNDNIVNDGAIDDEEAVMLSTGVYPPIFHGFRRKNIFCFRFFKNFKWRYVITDDRLPCKKVFNEVQTPKLIYGKCRNESEFWVPLLEKAYAKLHGSYESLISGFIDDGLVDLTGFAARKYIISPEDRSNQQKSDALWELIKSNSSLGADQITNKFGQELRAKVFTRNGTMMGCSIEAKVVESEVLYMNRKSGVLAGHAYAILDAFEIPKPNGKKRKTSRLLRIRNPWGFKEWTGKWSDESEEIEKNKQKIELVLKEKYRGTNEKIALDREDGTFVMSFRDFRMLFSKLFICYDFPSTFIGVRYFDEWTKAQSGGIPINNTPKELTAFGKNPQYYLNLKKDSFVYISLMQTDGRLAKAKFPYDGFTKKACLIVARAKGKSRMERFDNDAMVEITPIRQHREISIQANLTAGEYLIIPAIFKESETSKFCLEVYFNDTLTDVDKLKRVMTSSFNETLYDVNFLLTDNQLEKLGDVKAKCEIIDDEGREDSIKNVKQDKENFIYSQFLNILKDTDDSDYRDKNKKAQDDVKNRKKGGDKKAQLAEDDDWDEY